MAFSFNYKDLTYDQARNQAASQVNPLYQSALNKVQEQKRQNQLNAGQQATARGLSHSGLAADQQNKVSIAAQSQMADLEGQRVSKVNELAQSLIDRDRANNDRLYNRQYQLYRDNVSDSRYSTEFDYQKSRDGVLDKRWNDEFAYRKYRDSVSDDQTKQALEFEKAKFKSENDWRTYVYNNMSASEKAQLEWNKQQFGENMAWSIEESNRANKLARDQMEYEAGASGFLEP